MASGLGLGDDEQDGVVPGPCQGQTLGPCCLAAGLCQLMPCCAGSALHATQAHVNTRCPALSAPCCMHQVAVALTQVSTYQCIHGCQVVPQLCLVVVHQQRVGHNYQRLLGCQGLKDAA